MRSVREVIVWGVLCWFFVAMGGGWSKWPASRGACVWAVFWIPAAALGSHVAPHLVAINATNGCTIWLGRTGGGLGGGQVPSAYSLVSRLERSRRCTFPTSWRNKWNEYLIDQSLRLNSLSHSNLLSWIQGTICGLRKMKVGTQHTGNIQQVPHDSKKKGSAWGFSLLVFFFFFPVA